MILCLISLAIYLLFCYIVLNEFFIRHTTPRNDSYNRYKYGSCFRNLKFLVSLALVSLQQRRSRKQHLADETNRIRRMERPQGLEQFGVHANDAIAFQGSDDKGNQVLLRYGRRPNSVAEFWLLLKLVDENGHSTMYTHPEHPNAIFLNAEQNAYAAGGLRFEIMEPMRKWRIRYNGWMRKGFGTTADQDVVDSLVPLRFDFEWISISQPFFFHHELNAALLASGMADQAWSSEFFQQLREHSARGNETRYEQWGEISGQVIVDNSRTISVNVRGMRDHNSGPRDWQQYGRYIANMAITREGNFFHVGAVSMREGLKHLVYGYVGDSTGHLSPVTSCSIELARLGDDKTPPNDFTMAFKAGSKPYFVRVHVQDRIPVFNGVDWPSHSNLHFIQVELNGEIGYGFSEFEYRNLLQKTPDLKAVNDAGVFLDEIDIANLTRKELEEVLVPLGHRAGLCKELVGAKAQHLSQLWQLQGQFSVPKGAILLPAAFRHGRNESPAVFAGKIASKVRQVFAYDLRDTAVKENLADQTFTVLLCGQGSQPIQRFDNVRNVEEIFATSELLQFLEGKDAKSVGYSIVVQGTVQGDFFGHVWTCDPGTKSPTVVHVTVKDNGKNQEFVLNRDYFDNLSPSTAIGGAMETRVMKLAHLGLQLEKAFRSPRFIEYAELDGIMYILDCRPADE